VTKNLGKKVHTSFSQKEIRDLFSKYFRIDSIKETVYQGTLDPFPKALFVVMTRLVVDSGGFIYINPEIFPQAVAPDADLAQAKVMAATQKPYNQSILAEKSGPPAWKQLPTWYQISENDRLIPPDVERMFAKQINATTISLPSSHASPVSHPNEVAQLILDAANNLTRGEKVAQ
jgi:pimeloyl-ACP methyl ester carboxylesterase